MSDKKVKAKNPAFVILRRELRSYFSGPIGYIVTGLFLVINGLVFFAAFFLQNRAELRNFFSMLPMLLSFFIPAITMRVFSEEKRVGSIETLMTLPVREIDVVTGKYLAVLVEALVMLAPTLFYVITAEIFGSPDYGPIIISRLRSDYRRLSWSNLYLCCLQCNRFVLFFNYKKSDYCICGCHGNLSGTYFCRIILSVPARWNCKAFLFYFGICSLWFNFKRYS